MVVFSVLEVIPTHHLDLAEVRILLPLNIKNSDREFRSAGSRRVVHALVREPWTHVEEVNLLEQLLLVVFELPDHDLGLQRRTLQSR